MTEETQSVNSAVNGLLRMVQNQLNNTLSLVENQATLVGDAIAVETEDYNKIIDEIEKRDEQVSNLELKLASRSKLSVEDEKALQQELTEVRNKLARANVTVSAMATMDAELKKLRALNPERLNKKNKELRTEVKDKSDLLAKATSSLKDKNRQLSVLQSSNSKLSLDNSEMIQEIEKHRERLRVVNGEDARKAYVGGDSLEAHITIFDWGLTYRAMSIGADMLNDLTWHMEVRLNIGLGVIVSITKWLTPFFPHITTEIQDNWPKDINAAMVRIIVDKCSTSHPHLVDRVDWASGKLLSDLDISDKHLNILSDAGFTTVFSVVSTPVERLPNLLKGMGDKSCKQVMDVCNDAVTKWETENWTPEERNLH